MVPGSVLAALAASELLPLPASAAHAAHAASAPGDVVGKITVGSGLVCLHRRRRADQRLVALEPELVQAALAG